MKIYAVLALTLVLAGCSQKTVYLDASGKPINSATSLRVLVPKEEVIIGGCHYWRMQNYEGDTYAPKFEKRQGKLEYEGYVNCDG